MADAENQAEEQAALHRAEEQAARRLRKKNDALNALIAAFAAYDKPYAPKEYYVDHEEMDACILGSTSNPLDPLGDQRAYNILTALNYYYNCC